MRRFLRSSAMRLALGFFLAAPPPIFVYASVHAEPGQRLPDWVTASCCGPQDAHKLRADQVHQREGYWTVDGIKEKIIDKRVLPSGDGDFWAFYADTPAHREYSLEGQMGYDAPARQDVYCFFVPMNF